MFEEDSIELSDDSLLFEILMNAREKYPPIDYNRLFASQIVPRLMKQYKKERSASTYFRNSRGFEALGRK